MEAHLPPPLPQQQQLNPEIAIYLFWVTCFQFLGSWLLRSLHCFLRPAEDQPFFLPSVLRDWCALLPPCLTLPLFFVIRLLSLVFQKKKKTALLQVPPVLPELIVHVGTPSSLSEVLFLFSHAYQLPSSSFSAISIGKCPEGCPQLSLGMLLILLPCCTCSVLSRLFQGLCRPGWLVYQLYTGQQCCMQLRRTLTPCLYLLSPFVSISG